MDPQPIRSYRALWHAATNTGRIVLKLEEGEPISVKVDSPGELAAMDELLRHHQCYWDKAEQLLVTAWQTPGR